MWTRLPHGRTLINPYRFLQKRRNSEIIPPTLKKRAEYLTVALVGQPNVGKSTIFNYFCKQNKSIVTPFSGTTRDRKDGIGAVGGLEFRIIDTGGFDNRGEFATQIKEQVKQAILQCHVVLFVVDGKCGITSLDDDCANWLRVVMGSAPSTTYPRDIILLANKTEGSFLSDRALDIYSDSFRLGLDEPLLVSGVHGDGMSELATALIDCAEKRGLDTVDRPKLSSSLLSLEERVIEVALMGKQNVGKSSLLNVILKENRVITGILSGLTRDSIAAEWIAMNRYFRLIDTAGMVKIKKGTWDPRNRIEKKLLRQHHSTAKSLQIPGIGKLDSESDISQYSTSVSEKSMASSLSALRYAQVVVLVIEGQQGNFSPVDLKIARRCFDEGRAIVICANKRDRLAAIGVTARQYEKGVRAHCDALLKYFGEVPIVSTTALLSEQASLAASTHSKSLATSSGDIAHMGTDNSQGTDRLLRAIIRTHDAWSARIDTWVLNRWISDLQVSSSFPSLRGRPLRVKYMLQSGVRPPTFVLFASHQAVPDSYSRFIRNQIHKDFGLGGIPIRLVFRKSSGKATDPSKLAYSRSRRRNNMSKPVGSIRENQFEKYHRKVSQQNSRKRRLRLRKMRK